MGRIDFHGLDESPKFARSDAGYSAIPSKIEPSATRELLQDGH